MGLCRWYVCPSQRPLSSEEEPSGWRLSGPFERCGEGGGPALEGKLPFLDLLGRVWGMGEKTLNSSPFGGTRLPLVVVLENYRMYTDPAISSLLQPHTPPSLIQWARY